MKKVQIGLLLIAASLLVACDKTCTFTGTANTTYNYSYFDAAGEAHFGSVTATEGGSVEIQVPSDLDCGSVRYGEDKAPAPEQSAV